MLKCAVQVNLPYLPSRSTSLNMAATLCEETFCPMAYMTAFTLVLTDVTVMVFVYQGERYVQLCKRYDKQRVNTGLIQG